MPKHIIVLGAGPAGLSAAWELTKQGASVEVIEKESQVGGLCRSTNRNSFIFDLGGHRFISKDEIVLNKITQLMGEELLNRSRKSIIRLQDKFFNYPLELIDVLKKMPLSISFNSGLDYLLTKLHPPAKTADISFEDWVVRRFGRTIYEIYFGPYSQKLWGLPPNQISADWAAQRISLTNLTDVLLRALGKKKDIPKTYSLNFLYPKKGIGQISEYMLEEIRQKQGTVHLSATVKKIIFKNEKIEKIIYTQGAQEKEIAGDFVISTIPLPEFIMNTEPKLKDSYLDIAKKIHFRSLKFIHLILNNEYVSENTWIYIPEEKYLFFRVQDRRNWSPTTVPRGKNALTLEIACNKNDYIWNAPDEEIFDRCIKDLESMDLIARNQVADYFTEKTEHAYPIYFLDYQEKIKSLLNVISGIENCLPIGRQGLYRYNNMDHSIKMGILAAEHILLGYPRQKIFEIATENSIFER